MWRWGENVTAFLYPCAQCRHRSDRRRHPHRRKCLYTEPWVSPMMLMTAPVSMAAIAYCGLPMLRWISFVSPRPSETLSMAAALSPKKEAQPPAHNGDGKNEDSSGVAQVADAIADKNLIDNIIQTGDQQRYYAWHREFWQKLSYGRLQKKCAFRLFHFFHFLFLCKISSGASQKSRQKSSA